MRSNWTPNLLIHQKLSFAEQCQRGREYFVLLSTDGMRIPGVIQYPEGEVNLPAVVVIPGHTRAGDSGLSQLINEHDSYQHAAATRLAQAGYVTITIELRGFGFLGPPNYPDHKIVAYNQLLEGSNYKALILADFREILRYLEKLEVADASRIGVAGASLGGELSVAFAATTPSIKAIAFSSYIERGPFVGFGADRAKQPHYCHLIPEIGAFMRKEDVFKLLAPRATLSIRGAAGKSKYIGFAEELASAWKFYDQEESFNYLMIEHGEHEFYIDETIEFFNKNL